MYVHVIDARGKELHATLPRSIVMYEDSLSHHPTPSPVLYLGAPHFSDPDAIPQLERGPEESALYALLIRWCDSRSCASVEGIQQDPVQYGDADTIRFAKTFLSVLDAKYARPAHTCLH
jgi:hypothetical protein